MKCAVPAECEKEAKTRGWCYGHYERWLRYGDPLGTYTPKVVKCSIETCEKQARSRGWCPNHYAKWQRHGDPLAGVTYEHPGQGICKTCGEVFKKERPRDKYCGKDCRVKRLGDKTRKFRLASKYGMTIDDYEEMLRRQDGLCMICKSACSVNEYLSIDHDHETGKVRSLLCHSCNLGIGLFRESPEILQAAANYLMENP